MIDLDTSGNQGTFFLRGKIEGWATLGDIGCVHYSYRHITSNTHHREEEHKASLFNRIGAKRGILQ